MNVSYNSLGIFIKRCCSLDWSDFRHWKYIEGVPAELARLKCLWRIEHIDEYWKECLELRTEPHVR